MANNLNIGVNFTGNLGNLPGAAAAAAAALNGVGAAAQGAGAGLSGLGNASEHAFDEIAAGAAAMARIEAAIEATAAAARNAGTALQLIGQNAITSITPLNTLEARLRDIREAIGQSATVQGAANLGAQYEVINRNLQQTRNQIIAATTAAIGLGNAFNSIAGAGVGLNRLAPAIRPVLTNLNLIPPAANAAAASLARVRGSANQGGAALTDFSRIVQDAPFGIIGIGNNITQLAESFGRLRASSGSTGAAFRQLFSSAGGFGGIGLAISLITTALTFASVGFGAWTRGLTGGKKAAEDATKAAEEFAASLKSVSDVTGQATGGVQGQIVQVQALASVVTDANKSYDLRAAALRELQQVNKSYFGDLKLEETQMGALTARVNEYTQALVQQAVVKGFENEIGRVATSLYDQEKALTRAELGYKRLQSELDNTKSEVVDLRGDVQSNPVFTRLLKETDKAREAFVKQRDVVEKGRSTFVDLQGAMQRAVVESLKFRDITNSSTAASDKEADALKKRIAALKELQGLGGLTQPQRIELVQLEVQLARRDGIKLGFTPAEINQQVDDIIEKAFPVKTFEFKVKANIKLDTVSTGTPIDVAGAVGEIPEDAFDGVVNSIRAAASAAQDKLKASLREGFLKSTAESIQGGIIDAANLLGETLGDIFSGNIGEGIANAAQGFLAIIGGVLQEVGKQVVITSTLVQALYKVLGKLFLPGGASLGIAAGLGLIALGGLLKSIKIPGFAGGVENFGGGLAWVGEQGKELVNLPAGSDVIPNNRLGDLNRGGTIKLEAVISGQDIYLSNQRVAGMRRRI